jgi:hypothetical protein
MMKREPMRVQGLPRKLDGPYVIGAVRIPLLPDQGVAAQTCLDANLVSLPGLQADFDE